MIVNCIHASDSFNREDARIEATRPSEQAAIPFQTEGTVNNKFTEIQASVCSEIKIRSCMQCEQY